MRQLTIGVVVVLLSIGSGFAQQTPAAVGATLMELPTATWEPPSAETHGRFPSAVLHSLPSTAFAFPRSRKEPLTDAAHVRNAVARFSQVRGVTDDERELAFANIRKAAAHFGVHVRATDWRQLMGTHN